MGDKEIGGSNPVYFGFELSLPSTVVWCIWPGHIRYEVCLSLDVNEATEKFAS
jgi:hypothetical protein